MPNRRGVSLTELLIVMSISSVVLTTGVGLLHHVLHDQKKARLEVRLHLAAGRLSEQLRRDVHGSQRVSSNDEGNVTTTLVLEKPAGGSIRYDVNDNCVSRACTTPDLPVHRDEFEFPRDWRIEFQQLAVPPRIALSARSAESNKAQQQEGATRGVGGLPHNLVRVEAVIGRDHRFARAAD